VDLEDLAKNTKNYTGAEIEAVVKSATTWAIKN
jgi:SpoVK/Ycf46/Vps4 family AAA+-type ATPase